MFAESGVIAGFYPRPLCRERQYPGRPLQRTQGVSIHAPYAGSDSVVPFAQLFCVVSIHAPYAGSDQFYGIIKSRKEGFNPRPLCRERPPVENVVSYFKRFNPRPLCRERLLTFPHLPSSDSFNPRPLCRERLRSLYDRYSHIWVSIHAPYAGSDSRVLASCSISFVSIHAPYAGSD